ncbi:uncharacterized protein CFP56_038980 [Quercus suber]|uniref:Zinc knuckle CX2CX4HX4C domain-containing protein n=1 Tax=Quercus suber TaxID=58331 RepID=A0AAW0J132_QUESU
MTTETAREIGETIGSVINSSDESELKGGTFLRVRVRIDTTHPLCRGRKVTFEEGLERWVSFQYERLPNICFWCGLLSHDDKECEMWLKSKGSLTMEQQQFGHWIKASQFGPSRRHSVEVKGFSSPVANNLLSRANPSEGVAQQRDDPSGLPLLPLNARWEGGETENLSVMEPVIEATSFQEGSNPDSVISGITKVGDIAAGFEALLEDIDKELSDTQSISNPIVADIVHEIKGSKQKNVGRVATPRWVQGVPKNTLT